MMDSAEPYFDVRVGLLGLLGREYNIHGWMMYDGRWTMDDGRWTMDDVSKNQEDQEPDSFPFSSP